MTNEAGDFVCGWLEKLRFGFIQCQQFLDSSGKQTPIELKFSPQLLRVEAILVG